MANTLRIKRRTSGTSNGGVPTTSQCVNAELAFNEVQGTLYYGKGGNETASSSVVAIAGEQYSLINGVTAGTAAVSKALTLNSGGGLNGNISFYGAQTFAADQNSGEGGIAVDVYNGNAISLYHSVVTDGGSVRFGYGVEAGGANGNTWSISNDENYTGSSTTYELLWPNQTGRLATVADINSAIANAVGLSSSLKAPVAAATTANITLSGTQTIDGVALVAGDRVLVKDQTTATNNGIYVVAAGSWSRSVDTDTGAELSGASTFVIAGTVNGSKTFVNTNTGSITIGTTAVTFADQSSVASITAGAGLTKTGTTLDVASTGNGSLTITADSINLTSGIVTAGTYQAVTVDTYGRVTAGSNPTTLSGYGITDALSASTTSTQSGYFGDIYLYDDSTPSHYLQITNSANLSAARTFSINVNDGSRTLSLSGNLTVSADATVSGTNTGDQTISLSGDASGSGTSSITVTLANSGVTAGTYRSVTVDAKGRVTGGTNPTTFSGYAISDSSANLAAALTDETGFTAGAKAVFSTSPSFETSVVTSSTSFDVFNTTATTVNAFGAATALTIGGTTATNTVNVATGATGGGNTKTVNIGTAGTAGSTTNVNIGSATTGSTTNVTIGGSASGSTHTINGNVNFAGSSQVVAVQTGMTFRVDSGATAAFNNGAVTTAATTMSVFNLNATTVNAFGAATAITMGDATAATTTIRGGTLVGNTTTQAVFNTTATTVNAFGAATAVSIGAGSGNTTVNNNLIVTGNLTINGTTTTVNSTTVTVDDPIFTLGGDTAPASNDNKDRGIEFRWHNGTAAKVGFFGYDASASAFTFIPDATNASEVFSGTAGDVLFGKVNKVTITAPATGSTLTIADGKTLTASNTLTFAGTDSTTMTFPSSSTTVAGLSIGNAFTGANTFTNATGQTYRPAATQDGIIILGRAGGTSSYAVTLATATLSANRTITFPDSAGTVVTTSTICTDVGNCTLDGGTF